MTQICGRETKKDSCIKKCETDTVGTIQNLKVITYDQDSTAIVLISGYQTIFGSQIKSKRQRLSKEP